MPAVVARPAATSERFGECAATPNKIASPFGRLMTIEADHQGTPAASAAAVTRLRQEFAIKKWGVGIKLHSSNREARMSALGQDIDDRSGDVRFTPKADIGFGSDYAFGAAAPAAWRYSQQSFAPRLSDI